MSIEIDFKEKTIKEIQMDEKVVFTPVDGEAQEFVDIQEMLGVIGDEVVTTEYESYSLNKRKQILKVLGADDKVLGVMEKPWPAEFEQAPHSEKMRNLAIEHLLATDKLLRFIMDRILEASKEGKMFVGMPLIQQAHPRDIGKSTAVGHIPPGKLYVFHVLEHLGYRIESSGSWDQPDTIVWGQEYA